ncbi:hypothetical protein OROMI_027120 [Orobanche minor]
MASIGIHSGGNLSYASFPPVNRFNQFSSSIPLSSISSNKTKKLPKPLVSSSTTSSNPTLVSTPDSHIEDGFFLEKIDSWMQESVSEIVRNLKKAPLLVQIYSGNENGKVRIETEKAILDNWPAKKDEWRRNGESKTPEGLIFVEELGLDCDQENPDRDSGEGVTRAWGIIIQGKGVECGPACYLLKTNRVCAGMGLGFCTHFCLMRVNNLRDSAFEQFRDYWLLQ